MSESVDSPIAQPGQSRWRASRILFIVALLAISAFRIWFTADEGIGARYASHDDLSFVRAAEVGYWGFEKCDQLSLIRTPGYPLWLWANMQLGIPQRMAIDCAYVLSALFLVYALRRIGMGWLWATLTFAILAFAPETFRLFRVAMSDSLTVVTMNTLCASLLLLFVSRRLVLWEIVAGIMAGGFALVRGESPLLAGVMVGSVGGLLFLRSLLAKEGLKRGVLVAARAVVIPLALLVLVTQLACFISYRVYGIYALCDLSAPGHSAMIKALTRIKPSQRIEYVSISHEAMEMAYSVSPSLTELRPWLEGKPVKRWEDLSQARRPSIPAGELMSGVNSWAIREAAFLAGKYTSVRDADRFYKHIAKEVNAAIDSGKIPGRRVLSSFMDPDYGSWLPHVSGSLVAIWRTMWDYGDLPLLLDACELTPKVEAEFDKVCVRDADAHQVGRAALSGTVVTRGSPVVRLRVLNRAGMALLGTAKLGAPEPGATTQPIQRKNFQLDLARVEPGIYLKWDLTTANRETNRVDAQLLPRKRVLPLSDMGEGARIEINEAKIEYPPETARLRARRQIAEAYEYIIPGLAIAGPAAALLALVVRRRIQGVWIWCALFLLVAIASRVAIFTIIDATAFHGNQPRYIFPAVPPLLACAMLLLATGLCEIAGAVRRRRGASALTVSAGEQMAP